MQRKEKKFAKRFDNVRFCVRLLCERQPLAALDSNYITTTLVETGSLCSTYITTNLVETGSLCSTSPLFSRGG